MSNCIIITGGTWNKDDWSKLQRNVGSYRIASALQDSGYSTFVFDYIINFSYDEIIEVLDKHLGDDTIWVGFSSTFFWFPEHGATSGNGDILKLKEMWWTYDDDAKKIINYIKSKSKAKILYGGTKSEFFVGKDPDIDYYVLGLADTAVINLTKHIETNDITYLDPHHEILNYDDGRKGYFIDAMKYPQAEMDNIRTHWWKKEFNILPKEALSLEFARGCIFKCKFCTYPLLGKAKGSYLRQAKEIRDDMILNYEAYGTTDYFITDDTVNDDNDKLEELHKQFQTLPFKPKITGFFRLDLINKHRHQAELLVEMGLVGVFFGIETLHPKSAISIGKGLHPNKVKDCLNWLHDGPWKRKVNIGGGIILGLPHDTFEYFDEINEWAADKYCPMDHVQFYPLHLNDMSKKDKPGLYVSEFNLHPEIYGYKFPGEDNYMRWELPEQGLSYTLCNEISKEFNKNRALYNKVSGFEIPKWLNLGIPMDDLYDLPAWKLIEKYNVSDLNKKRLNEYKKMLGVSNIK